MTVHDYHERVASLPCVICKFKLGVTTYPVSVHHAGDNRDDWYVAALCHEHHQGATGVHGLRRRGFCMKWHIPGEAWLVARTTELLEKSR